MPSQAIPPTTRRNLLAAAGPLYAAIAVALSAYAAHAAHGEAQSRLQTAAIFAFGHGVALAALAPTTRRRVGWLGLLAICIGVVLFSGSIAGSVLAQWPATLAPLGGMWLIGGWVMLAIDLLRR